jgi:hypothetical protein
VAELQRVLTACARHGPPGITGTHSREQPGAKALWHIDRVDLTAYTFQRGTGAGPLEV